MDTRRPWRNHSSLLLSVLLPRMSNSACPCSPAQCASRPPPSPVPQPTATFMTHILPRLRDRRGSPWRRIPSLQCSLATSRWRPEKQRLGPPQAGDQRTRPEEEIRLLGRCRVSRNASVLEVRCLGRGPQCLRPKDPGLPGPAASSAPLAWSSQGARPGHPPALTAERCAEGGGQQGRNPRPAKAAERGPRCQRQSLQLAGLPAAPPLQGSGLASARPCSTPAPPSCPQLSGQEGFQWTATSRPPHRPMLGSSVRSDPEEMETWRARATLSQPQRPGPLPSLLGLRPAPLPEDNCGVTSRGGVLLLAGPRSLSTPVSSLAVSPLGRPGTGSGSGGHGRG